MSLFAARFCEWVIWENHVPRSAWRNLTITMANGECKVNRRRFKFGWNGERFAQSVEIEAFIKRHSRDELIAIENFLRAELLAVEGFQ